MSGLTSASEDETDADEYGMRRDGDEEDMDEPRTAAIVVAEEGRGLIVHGEGQNVAAVNIQPGMSRDHLESSRLIVYVARHNAPASRIARYPQLTPDSSLADVT